MLNIYVFVIIASLIQLIFISLTTSLQIELFKSVEEFQHNPGGKAQARANHWMKEVPRIEWHLAKECVIWRAINETITNRQGLVFIAHFPK